MSKYRYGLTTFSFLLVVVFTCIFGDYFCGIIDGGFRTSSILEIVTISLTILIPAIAFYIKEKVYNHSKPNWIVFILLLALMGCGMYGIWATPNGRIIVNETSFDYEVDLITRITWTLGMIFSFITFYLLIVIWSKRFASLKWLRAIYFIILLVGFASIAYSLVFDKEEYELLFKGEDNFYPWINSFFDNKNTFGQFMLICVISVVMLDSIKPHWWHVFYFIIFLGFTFFSTSFTSIVITHLVVVLFYLYKLIITFKKHPYRNSLLLGFVLLTLVAMVGAGVILYYKEYKPVFRFGNFLVDVFDKDFNTATSRTKVWKAALETLQTPLEWAFGHGYRNFNLYFHNYFLTTYKGPTFACDNTFIQLVGSYGLVGISLYFCLLGLFGYALIYSIHKRRYKIAIPASLVGVSMLIYSIFETAVLFETSLVGLLLFLIIVLPGLIEYSKANPRKDVIKVSLLHNVTYEYRKRWNEVNVTTFASFIILTLFIMVVLSNYYSEIGVGIILVLFLSWIFLAPLFGIWSKSESKAHRLTRYILLPLILYGVPFLGTYLALLYKYTFKAAAVGYVAFFIAILMIEFIITCLINHSFKEYGHLFLHGAFLPLILPLSIHLVIFLSLNWTLFYFGLITMVSMQLINVIAQITFVLFIPYLINLPKYRRQIQFMVDDINNLYISRQRGYLLKDFTM